MHEETPRQPELCSPHAQGATPPKPIRPTPTGYGRIRAEESNNMRVSSRTNGWKAIRLVPVVAMVAAGALCVVASASAMTEAATPNAKITPKKGGTLNMRLSAAPDCLDPQKTSQSSSFEIFDPLFDTLV